MRAAGTPQNSEEEVTVTPQPPLCCLPERTAHQGFAHNAASAKSPLPLAVGTENPSRLTAFVILNSGVLTVESWEWSGNKQ